MEKRLKIYLRTDLLAEFLTRRRNFHRAQCVHYTIFQTQFQVHRLLAGPGTLPDETR